MTRAAPVACLIEPRLRLSPPGAGLPIGVAGNCRANLRQSFNSDPRAIPTELVGQFELAAFSTVSGDVRR